APYHLSSLTTFFFLLTPRRPPVPPLFPYTTLFRSRGPDQTNVVLARDRGGVIGRAVVHDDDFVIGVIEPAQPLARVADRPRRVRSEEHTSELQSRFDLVCRLLLEKKKKHV